MPSAGLWDLAELPPEPSAHSATVGGRSAAGGADADGDAEFGDVPSPSWLDDPRGTSWRARLVPERFRGTRFDPGRRGVVTLAALGCVAVVVATALALRERPVAHPVPPLPAVRTTATAASARPPGAVPPLSVAAAAGAAPSTNPGGAPSETELVVSVVGLVHRGGLVRLPAGARVADAIAAAGGAKEGADLNGINLAKRLLDGDQVLVGSSGPTTGQLGSTTISADGRPADANAGTPHRTGRVNLSTATEADLEELPGVGPVTAHAIIAWRTANGRFTSVEQLAEVDGIGPARLAKLRELVTV